MKISYLSNINYIHFKFVLLWLPFQDGVYCRRQKVHEIFFDNSHRKIGHTEDLTGCLQKLINMVWQKNFHVVGDRALQGRMITLLRLKNYCKAKRTSHSTVCETARETGIHRSGIHRITRKDLALKCMKKKQEQNLTDANKEARMVHARQLLRHYPDHMVKFIWFSDEKLFSVAEPVKTQNDHLYVPVATKKDISVTRLLKTRSSFSKSMMVSVAVSSLSISNIHVIESVVKINGAYYRNIVLRRMLLPDIRTASGSKFFVFQQDRAPSHCSKDTVALLEQKMPDFIPPMLRPHNSPNLNLVDYSVWSVLQEQVHHTNISDVDELKQRIKNEWADLKHAVIECAVGDDASICALVLTLKADISSI